MTQENQTQDQNTQTNLAPNPYEIYRKYYEEQNRIWINWWTQVLKNVWGIKQ